MAFLFGKGKQESRDSGENPSKALLESGTELPDIKRLNASLYEFHAPADGKAPEVEVMFFHGLQKRECASKAYLHTWVSRDRSSSNSFYWPQKLLADEFPTARIFSVSYDSCTSRGAREGIIDLYCVAENLLQDLTQKGKGHRSGCPVILVGKDIGGLVIKAICFEGLWNCSDIRRRYQSFLDDIKGILYYCTPHRGFTRLPSKFDGAMFKNLGFEDADIPRLSERFNQLKRTTFKWETRTIGVPGHMESELCIPEGSLRDGDTQYYTASQDLHSLARPLDKTDTTYNFLSEMISNAKSDHEPSSFESSSSRKFLSSLPFEFDEYYVPMKNTLREIRNAFDDGKSRVVLHGDSGAGKSSLARYYALCFEEKAMKKLVHDKSSSPVVCYVSCGSEAVVAVLRKQILETFGVQFELDIKESQFQQMQKFRTILSNHLRHVDALVILDDVWEWKLLEMILVPDLKYLITSRKADLWHHAQSIKIQDVNLEDGRQILAKYAKFEEPFIPEQFQDQADGLIRVTSFHPLALATLGTVLGTGNKYDADEWKDLTENFLLYMESEEYQIINCDLVYPRSVSAALMLMLDEKILGADAMNLFCVISLFQGPQVPESLVKSFLEYCQPTALRGFHRNKRTLKNLSLVHTERRLISFSFAEITEVEGANRKGRSLEFFVVHHLRQLFMFEKRKEYMNALTAFLRGDRIFCSLGNTSKEDWATLLCAVSGMEAVKEEAQKRIGRFNRWSPRPVIQDPDRNIIFDFHSGPSLSHFLSETLHLLPEDIEGQIPDDNSSNRIRKACTEVLWTFFISCNVSGEKISGLLKEKISLEWASRFLAGVAVILYDAKQEKNITNAFIAVGRCLETFLRVVAVLGNVPTYVVDNSLLILFLLADLQSQKDLLHTKTLLEQLFAWRMDSGRMPPFLIMVISRLAWRHPAVFVQVRGLLDKLMDLLAEDVPAYLQETALHALCQIPGEEASKLVTVTSDLLLRIVPFLSKDLGRRCQLSVAVVGKLVNAETPSNAEMVVNCPACLQKLIQLLAEDVDADLQEAALEALKNIASHILQQNAIIIEVLATVTSDILTRIVPFLSQDLGMRCALSVTLIGYLAGATSFAIMIVNSPACFRKLIQLLAEDADAVVQVLVLLALSLLVHHAHENAIILDSTVTVDLLQRVAPFLAKGLGMASRYSVSLIKILVRDPAIGRSVAMLPDCLDRLVDLLARDAGDETQECSIGVITCMAMTLCGEEEVRRRMVGTKGLLEAVIGYVEETVSRAEPIPGEVMQAVACLSACDEAARQIICNMDIRSNLRGQLYRRWCYEKAMRGSYASALDDINEALELDSCSGILWQERGVLRRLMENYHGALEDLDRALEIDMDDYECLKHRALVKFLTGNEEGASADAERAISVKPSRADNDSYGQGCLGMLSVEFMTYNLKCWFHEIAMRESYAAALSDINKALELDSGSSFLWQDRGVLRRLMKDYDGALEDLDRALEVNEDDYECLTHRALVKSKMGNEGGSSADTDKAISIKRSRVDDDSYRQGFLGGLSVKCMTHCLK